MTRVAFVARNIGRPEIAFYRSAGMALFIVVGYVRNPSRLWRTARNLVRGRSESAVEERLAQLLMQPLRRLLPAGSAKGMAT